MSRISVQTAESKKTGTFDLWLLGAALVLAGLGLVMVFSSSGVMAERLNGNRYYFFHRQGIFALGKSESL